MKILYFIGWLLNYRRYHSYQLRFIAYVALGFGLGYTIDHRLIMTPLVLIWMELVIWMMKDAWNSFCREQKNIINKLKGDR